MALGVVPELGGRTLRLVLSLFVGLELRADIVRGCASDGYDFVSS